MEHTPAQAPATTDTSSVRRIRPSVMDEELTSWALYDLTPADSPDTPDNMREYFRRFRAARHKTIEGAGHEALQHSWCAFIKRWNLMQPGAFVQWLDHREVMLQDHSLSELRNRLCEFAWSGNQFCYVHLSIRSATLIAIGSQNTAGLFLPVARVDRCPVGVGALDLVLGRLVAGVITTKHQLYGPHSLALARHRERCFILTNHVGEILKKGGTWLSRIIFRRESKPTHKGTYARPESRDWEGNGYDFERERQDGLHDSRYAARSTGFHPRSQLLAEGRRVDNGLERAALEDVDLAVNRTLDAPVSSERAKNVVWRAERTLEQIRQSNRELLHRVRELEDHFRGGHRGIPRLPQRAPGSDGSMARQARREGRSTHAPPT
ncbi:hypothetical protein F443_20283 [Phytophthora nicotianae P1569]|uniref:Uncharacterized protein n=1 Tax=Phytophthora nicotianae P1569 TaxID=1317065 RepID=V9E234_PHYNI|nr:hypothetical protein F443_20283 [Phytophthora nicotianae P1569]